MTTQIRVLANSSKTFELVNELKVAGYKIHVDFEFEYFPCLENRFSGKPYPSYVLFTFFKDSLATWFSLRYT